MVGLVGSRRNRLGRDLGYEMTTAIRKTGGFPGSDLQGREDLRIMPAFRYGPIPQGAYYPIRDVQEDDEK